MPGLTHVEFYGTPDRAEIAALRQLPALTSLTAHQPDTVEDLIRLPALQRLTIDDVPAAHHSAVLATLKRAKHLTITVDGRTAVP